MVAAGCNNLYISTPKVDVKKGLALLLKTLIEKTFCYRKHFHFHGNNEECQFSLDQLFNISETGQINF